MSNIIGYTRGGTPWEPKFISELEQENCIGCGRCYKVCSRDVFNLVERQAVDDDDDDLYDDYDDDEVMMVMAVENEADCVGCGACAKVCPKNCHSFEPATMP
ncbi:ferredoxin III, nif-specific [Vibrio sp. JC009]|uniref:ferredoxin III, nif-specific n=1 Tax=Vibrio sp. JC009 TaxID=2912314 RepID=UPI0023AF49E9|nr:ferredoxin III, nif-specific [Vibrio sp. JC009]WED24076.1 ferredoxin III, nif-specific [Vibrio sp. JC009]